MHRQRSPGEWRIGRQAQQVDDRRRQVAQAHGLGDGAARRSRRREDHQRDVNLVEVQAIAMVEHTMLPELFSMVRRDDHQGVLQHANAVELVQQRPDLPVQEGDAIVVTVAGQLHVPGANVSLILIPVVQEHLVISPGPGPEAEPRSVVLRRQEGLVRVEVVQKGEERPLPPPLPGKPVQEGAVDPAGVPRLVLDPFAVVEVAVARARSW